MTSHDVVDALFIGSPFTMEDLVHEYRKRVIEAAMRAEENRPSRAARRLGISRERLFKLRKRYGLPISPSGEREIPADFRERLKRSA